MDVLSFYDRVTDGFARFSGSFTATKTDDIPDCVDGLYGDEGYWPSLVIQLNASFVGTVSTRKLVEQCLLFTECRQIFRWSKEDREEQELQLQPRHRLRQLC